MAPKGHIQDSRFSSKIDETRRKSTKTEENRPKSTKTLIPVHGSQGPYTGFKVFDENRRKPKKIDENRRKPTKIDENLDSCTWPPRAMYRIQGFRQKSTKPEQNRRKRQKSTKTLIPVHGPQGPCTGIIV